MKHILLLLSLTLLFACGQERNYNAERIKHAVDSASHADSLNPNAPKLYIDDKGRRQGYWITLNSTAHIAGYSDADTIELGCYKDGKKEGLWIEYYPGGAIKAKLTYKDDSLIKRDTLTFEMSMKPYTDANGLKQGYWTILNSTAHLPGYFETDKVEEGIYVNDKKEGVWIEYLPGNKIKDKVTYKDDKVVKKNN
jgi:hypothetical protein